MKTLKQSQQLSKVVFKKTHLTQIRNFLTRERHNIAY